VAAIIIAFAEAIEGNRRLTQINDACDGFGEARPMSQIIPTFAERAWECECLAELTRFPEMAEQMRRLAALYRQMAARSESERSSRSALVLAL
jgi:hypothetical protein